MIVLTPYLPPIPGLLKASLSAEREILLQMPPVTPRYYGRRGWAHIHQESECAQPRRAPNSRQRPLPRERHLSAAIFCWPPSAGTARGHPGRSHGGTCWRRRTSRAKPSNRPFRPSFEPRRRVATSAAPPSPRGGYRTERGRQREERAPAAVRAAPPHPRSAASRSGCARPRFPLVRSSMSCEDK